MNTDKRAITRRTFLSGAGSAMTAVAAGRFLVGEQAAGRGFAWRQRTAAEGRYREAFAALDTFVEQYLRAMNAPGLTLAVATRNGIERVASYGFSDVEERLRVTLEHLFQIGSISKSFVGLCALQLRDEGKLDLQAPVTRYLPWFRVESKFSPIAVHHLLTHTSGLPGAGLAPVFPSDPAARHLAAYEPGQHFHYNNTAYELLGHLLWTLDGRPIGEIFRRRIFEPLGMTSSEPVITLGARPRMARNYAAFQNDRPLSRFGRLAEAPALMMTNAAGCIAATPRDMGEYMRMILRGGEGPRSRILSEAAFDLFSRPHVPAPDFGKDVSYGYGIAVDTLEGHRRLRHTGGMLSFMSALQLDMDSGVGAFASINAQQGYRPNPVAQYALQLLRAVDEGKPLPAAQVDPATRIAKAQQYAGSYTSPEGERLELAAEGETLFATYKGTRTALEGGPAAFMPVEGELARFALVAGRASQEPESEVVEFGWGSQWFAKSSYAGSRKFDYPKEWDAFTGHYYNGDPWVGSTRIVLRKGKLFADGVNPLEPIGDGRFWLRTSPHSPEWVSFHDVVNGKAMRAKFSGVDLWRQMAD